jgi:hypothetical protein
MTLASKGPKLIVHIGAGKTGSSSIQITLRECQEELRQQGFKYLGLMLEHVDQKTELSWHFTGGSDVFFGLRPATAAEDTYGILRKELEKLQGQGINTAIWSNEWMFTRDKWVLPAIKRLRDDGYEIEIIVYVRRHDKWAKSAYAQWGLKHKTYTGPLKSFRDWSKGRDFSFFTSIEPWLKVFPGAVSVFNYDSSGEIVSHFCRVIGFSPPKIVQDNVTPSDEVLAAWAIFNSRFQGEVQAARFEGLVRGTGLLTSTSVGLPPLNELRPTDEDLTKLWGSYSLDRVKVNELLVSRGEPPLLDSPIEADTRELDPWKMTQVLLKIIFSLDQQLTALRGRVKKLESGDQSN